MGRVIGKEWAIAPNDEQSRLEDALRAPLMIAVLLAAERADLPLERVVSPAVSFRLAASALSELSPFRADFDHNLAWLLARRERVQPFAERLLSAAAATWWWEPMDPDRQVWSRTGGTADHPSAVDVARPTLPVGEARRLWAWENYAHKPSRVIQTSTLGTNGETSFLVATHLQVPDIIGPRENIDRSSMPMRRPVRVFEINGPADWHRLATTHRSEVDLRSWGLTHDVDRVVPRWSKVEKRWDGVHLSLGGLLLATEVAHESDAGLTRLWAWESEQNRWLSWVFGAPVPQPRAFPSNGPACPDDEGYVIDIPFDPTPGQ